MLLWQPWTHWQMYFKTNTMTTYQIVLSYFCVFGCGMFISAMWSEFHKPNAPGMLGLFIGLVSACIYLGTRLG